MRRWLMLSLLLHLALALVFMTGTPIPTPREKLEVTYLSPSKKPAKRRHGRKKSRRLSADRDPTKSLKLTPRWSVSSNDGTDAKSDPAGADTSGWNESDWGVRGGDFGEIVNYLPYERIQEQVRAALHYPSILGRRGIEGTVNVRLAFTEGAGCDWKKSRVTASRRPLAIYVIALLKDICRLNITRSQALAAARFLDFSFMFNLSNGAHSRETEEARDFIVGNVLSFHRTYPESAVQYHIGPLTGVWFLPMVSLDWPWILEKWDHYVNGVDPMSPFRD